MPSLSCMCSIVMHLCVHAINITGYIYDLQLESKSESCKYQQLKCTSIVDRV